MLHAWKVFGLWTKWVLVFILPMAMYGQTSAAHDLKDRHYLFPSCRDSKAQVKHRFQGLQGEQVFPRPHFPTLRMLYLRTWGSISGGRKKAISGLEHSEPLHRSTLSA